MSVTPAADRATRDPEHVWLIGRHPEVSDVDRARVSELMLRYKHAFAYSMNELAGGYTGDAGPAYIQTLNPGKYAYARPRMLSPLHKGIVDKKCKELLEAGMIEPAPFSRHASRLTVAAKKDANGEWVDQRMCGDYREQNLLNATQQTRSANSEELFREIGNSKFFSKT